MRGARPGRTLELALARTNALKDGESVVVACSGGPDSVALAAALAAVASKRGWQLALAHVNHGLRASASQDEAVVLHVGAALGLQVRVVALEGAARGEAALRKARYAAFARVARELGANAVATAHTAEDQTETVLMALFRGTGTGGLAGIPNRRPMCVGVDLCRPLLRWDHAALRRYCQQNGVPYALDPTNADLRYRRNAVRTALGALRFSFPALDRAVARAAQTVADELAGESRALSRRRVREALRASGALVDVDFEHVESAVRALERGRSGEFHMRPKVALRIRQGSLSVEKRR
jgi:tRNA(Ile)-lysidine synthase